ncbi:MAG TPA: methylenetetrahydrofolate reductase [NAD(P)H] [Spirochaetota bacterium]|nr:methylenetetrahydrofolate reductase [NAD(P)H] [Spirochaetota bacterium]HOK92557.1 methylenetetrahydrofolate reductase [NAD(P)H] [Spirochaetota bacterium]HPP95066.1 methylenetetrahydrofolate reductase [NAD(P)H] [Spirochaetota bacterium]HRS62529.1 methylenetetrahydrofolate reductase [NAD(P)H] [Spirochaetota bacterium]HRU66290.1 methylenetetrahydrofolate reductase [NAD(P)H] [Spirochaetota bacterium]
MHIREILEKHKISFSFEFFPPKTEKGSEALFKTISELVPLNPAYVSVTYGAGGSSRDLTHDLIVKIQNQTNLTVVSHLTCVGSTKEEIHNILSRYKENNIMNIMALRGDPPAGESKFKKVEGGFEYACELVEFIKKHFPYMGIGVAGYPEGHPETPNRIKEMDNLKRKVDAGADYICTQLFFDNNDFYDFRERCEIAGIHVPIIAGIMPVTSIKGMYKMAELALGTKIPAKLQRALLRAEDDSYVEKVGIHWATQQVYDLIDNGVKGIHFYTLNQSKATREIYASIGISNSESLNK